MPPVVEAFQEIAGFPPNPMQRAVFPYLADPEKDCALLLKAPTGTGKTEAVLVPCLTTVFNSNKPRRLWMIYPARSLIEDQIGRIERMQEKLSHRVERPLALVVDTGGTSRRVVFYKGEKKEEGPRHLYDGDVILTTLDKFLYRFFGFGEEKKAYIFPFRVCSPLRRNIFCFDEAHAYDDVAFTNFVRLVRALYTAGLDVVVMTATMPRSYAQELHFLHELDFIDAHRKELENWRRQQNPSANYTKTLRYLPEAEGEKLKEHVLHVVNERISPTKRIIITVESVRRACEIYDLLKAQHPEVLLYHGRLDDERRRTVYQQLKRREEQEEGYLLVTTSAIEVGCDLNADHLLTQFCLPDQLIQRAGRCNRKGDREDAEILVFGTRLEPWQQSLGEERELEQQLNSYLNDRANQPFDPLPLINFLDCTKRPIYDYRTEVLFDMLYEYVYEARRENKPLHDKGLVITRSWEPSVILTTKASERGLTHPVSVPLSYCATHNKEQAHQDKSVRVLVRFFDERRDEWVFEELKYSGWAYSRDLVIEVPEEQFDEERGYVDLPTPFHRVSNDGYRARLAYKPREGKAEEREVWLFFLDRKPKRASEAEEQGEHDEELS